MIGVRRQRSANVKRWRDGTWRCAGAPPKVVEAGKQFRRVNGHLHRANLRTGLEREVAEIVGGTCHDALVKRGPRPEFYGTRDILLSTAAPRRP